MSNHANLLRNAVVWATNETTPVSVEGQGVLDVSIWEQANSMTVHLVNLTNPMMMKGPVREVFPSYESTRADTDQREATRGTSEAPGSRKNDSIQE